MAILNATKL